MVIHRKIKLGILVVAMLAIVGVGLGGFRYADPVPTCPDTWPAYTVNEYNPFGHINYEGFHDGYFVSISTDSNGYTTGRAYEQSDGYEVGYIPGEPAETCYVRMDTEEQIIFPYEEEEQNDVIRLPITVPTVVAMPTSIVVPTVVVPILTPESTLVPVPESTVVVPTNTPRPEPTNARPVQPTLEACGSYSGPSDAPDPAATPGHDANVAAGRIMYIINGACAVPGDG